MLCMYIIPNTRNDRNRTETGESENFSATYFRLAVLSSSGGGVCPTLARGGEMVDHPPDRPPGPSKYSYRQTEARTGDLENMLFFGTERDGRVGETRWPKNWLAEKC